ncbi:Mn superoxide dismutase [Tricholoma matsutake]|nr:Mn superoxide dismutase [Tricholoma matsutake 945]
MLSIARSAIRPTLSRSFVARSVASVHTLPNLPYKYDALEPFISTEIMKLHHSKHHQAYVNGLNAAEEAYAKTQSTKEKIALQAALKFNGGGHINHSFFWKILAPSGSGGGQFEDGPLKTAIERTFGGVAEFQKAFNTKAATIQGSGWAWLGHHPETEELEIVTTANQDPLISHKPVIGVDMWEHAYYLQYFNNKADYLNRVWNVVNFSEAQKRYLED